MAIFAAARRQSGKQSMAHSREYASALAPVIHCIFLEGF
jgi:hypothetical protein